MSIKELIARDLSKVDSKEEVSASSLKSARKARGKAPRDMEKEEKENPRSAAQACDENPALPVVGE